MDDLEKIMNGETGEKKDGDMRIIEDAAIKLMNTFDTVQIFVTRYSGNGTMNAHVGRGNWYARFGHVRLWVKAEENNSRFENKEDF